MLSTWLQHGVEAT